MTGAGERPILDTVHNASISNHSAAIFYYNFLLFGPGSWWAKCYARARIIYAVTWRYKNPIKACFLVGGGRAAIPSSTTASYPRLNHPQILCIFIIFYTGVLYHVVTVYIKVSYARNADVVKKPIWKLYYLLQEAIITLLFTNIYILSLILYEYLYININFI